MSKAIIERHNRKIGRQRERRQIGIRSDVCGQQRTLRVRPPDVQAVLEARQRNRYAGRHKVDRTLPIHLHLDGVCRKDFPIGRKAKNAHLSDLTKTATVVVNRFHPGVRGCMVSVRSKRQSNPEIDIRKVLSSYVSWLRCLRHEEFQRFVRSPGECFPVDATPPADKYDRNKKPTGYFKPDHLNSLSMAHMKLKFEDNLELPGPLTIDHWRRASLRTRAARPVPVESNDLMNSIKLGTKDHAKETLTALVEDGRLGRCH